MQGKAILTLTKAILIFGILFAGCGTLTPAQKLAVDIISCRYAKVYVPQDASLSEAQKAERIQMTRELREALKLSPDCDAGR
jgi:hypothetical protein